MASALLLLSSIAAAGSFGTRADAFDAFNARLDGDGDGALSPAEYALTGDPSTFSQLDVDANGQVTPLELRLWVTLTDPRPATPPLAPDAAGEPPPPERTARNAVIPQTVKPAEVLPDSGFGWSAGWLAAGGAALLALLIGIDPRARRGLRALWAPSSNRRGSR